MNESAISRALEIFDSMSEDEQRELSEKILWRLYEAGKKRPPTPEGAPRPVGLAKGEFIVTDEFFEPLPEDLLRAFNGENPDPLLDSHPAQ